VALQTFVMDRQTDRKKNNIFLPQGET
jgi:hypothetical protein